MSSEPDDLDTLSRDLGILVARLLERTHEHGSPQVGPLVCQHLGEGAESMPIVSDTVSRWDQANLQLALDAAVSRPGWSAELVGISGQARHYSAIGLGDIMRTSHFPLGAVEHATVDVGPGRTLACVDFAILLIASPDGPLAALVHRVGDSPFERGSDIRIQVAAGERERSERLLADLRGLIEEHDVYRGQLVTIESSPGGTRLAFLERPVVDAEDVVLPEGALARIERHLAGPTVHRERLLAMGRHLSRGLLLWGPPGTGKTLTVRYLTGRLSDCTVIILSGGALAAIGAFGTIARRLAPSVVVLEDVDLVAEDRDLDGGGPLLFELMNQMSGYAEDADVAFVLTTNRPAALEAALAARPGRVDLAVEIPLPDAAARRRLIDIYARGLDLALTDVDAVVERTEGVTASFVKELLRKAALAALDAGRETVTDADVSGALDELLSDTAALTRSLLGTGGAGAAGTSRGWLERFPDDDGFGSSGEFLSVEIEP